MSFCQTDEYMLEYYCIFSVSGVLAITKNWLSCGQRSLFGDCPYLCELYREGTEALK
jgi:hypothetical protein